MVAKPTYRYHLHRAWDIGGECITWCMLNPSTADETRNDPTIRRCINFSKAWGFARLRVVNLFAVRSTDPAGLSLFEDPVGPDNDEAIMEAVAASDVTVAAWGAHPFAASRAAHVRLLMPRAQCLAHTKTGEPRHPLYMPNNSVLRPL